ncbi:hypothetical protein GCM10010123_08740 [Pilimelia anulata]|uniref:Uncharacterized protein n=1 Tax=Pilimelia anulata TaxID=53371 RepID=A0A8J3B7D3_9ACTN|nr:hypothetical protein [Pilimelia anulata]GGJ81190.1 hypothetical protein GCM10010123_08740 [Pilimelia anulata]
MRPRRCFALAMILFAVLSFTLPVPASAAATGLAACRPGEGNSGKLALVRGERAYTVTVAGWVRRCRPLPGPADRLLSALVVHSMDGSGESWVTSSSPAYPPGKKFARKFAGVNVGVYGFWSKGLVCLHAGNVTLDCWYIVMRSAQGKPEVMSVGRMWLRPPYDKDTHHPRPNCGTCW